MFGMTWRFLPVSDPLVDVTLSRDLDSLITMREVAAVEEWLNSSHSFHIMVDHPGHGKIDILGGLWGAKKPPGPKTVALDNAMRQLIDDVSFGGHQSICRLSF